MLITGHFYSEALLISPKYVVNYINLQRGKNDKSTENSSKGILVLSEYAKSSERRVFIYEITELLRALSLVDSCV